MSESDHRHLLALIAATRNRLWLENILTLLERVTWGLGVSLIAAGLVHIFLAPVPWRLALGLCALALGIAFAAGLALCRPSREGAAAAADRRLEGKELFVSAFEQTGLAEDRRPGASRFLLVQAERRASAALEKGLGKRPPLLPVRRLMPPALAVSGVFLLLSPGLERQPRFDQRAGALLETRQSLAGAEAGPEAVLRLRREIDNLRAEMTRPRDALPGARAAGPVAPSRQPSAPADAAPSRPERRPAGAADGPEPGPGSAGLPPEPGQTGLSEGPQPGRAGRRGAGGEDTPGRSADRQPAAKETVAALDLATRAVEIARPPGESAGAGARKLDPSQPGLAQRTPAEAGAGAPGAALEGAYEIWLVPTLRAYAGRYLATLRQGQ